MAQNIENIVFGTHQYQWLMKPYGLLQKKYWPEKKITYFCDKQTIDLPENIVVKTIPRFKEWNWKKEFSKGIYAAIESIDKEAVMISLPDMWPISKVNDSLLESIGDLVKDKNLGINKKILRIMVGDDIGKFQYLNNSNEINRLGVWNDLTIKTCSTDHPRLFLAAGFLLFPSIWNRNLLLEYLEKSECNDWEEWESCQTKKMNIDEHISCWIEPIHLNKSKWWQKEAIVKELDWEMRIKTGAYIYPFSHVLERTDARSLNLNGIDHEDIKMIIDNSPSWLNL